MSKNKIKTIFSCQNCDYCQSQWTGRCVSCEQWNTFVKKNISSEQYSNDDNSTDQMPINHDNHFIAFSEISVDSQKRYSTGFKEVDQVLGGGIPPSSIILFSGEPGIGKSTLLLQIAHNFCNQGKILYVSGEESASQIKLRSQRLKLDIDMNFHAGTNLEIVLSLVQNLAPKLLILDSIQTLYSETLGSVPGTAHQIKHCAYAITAACKKAGTACFMVAHITKDGSVSGPKVLEHLVDTVLYFEQGDQEIRLLRAIKNRFGAVDELGFFTMTEYGLVEILQQNQFVQNPAQVGSFISASYEGSRVFFHEIQALTVPVRIGSGGRIYSERIELHRTLRITAVLEKHVGLSFSDQDVYVNVSGGVKLREPGIDLPLALALYSARTGVSFPMCVGAGEVTLSGNIRCVSHSEKRVRTAKEFGFPNFLGIGNCENMDIKIFEEQTLQELIFSVLKNLNLKKCNKSVGARKVIIN